MSFHRTSISQPIVVSNCLWVPVRVVTNASCCCSCSPVVRLSMISWNSTWCWPLLSIWAKRFSAIAFAASDTLYLSWNFTSYSLQSKIGLSLAVHIGRPSLSLNRFTTQASWTGLHNTQNLTSTNRLVRFPQQPYENCSEPATMMRGPGPPPPLCLYPSGRWHQPSTLLFSHWWVERNSTTPERTLPKQTKCNRYGLACVQISSQRSWIFLQEKFFSLTHLMRKVLLMNLFVRRFLLVNFFRKRFLLVNLLARRFVGWDPTRCHLLFVTKRHTI